jgi:Mrp family chromosome partitioning ATPase
MSRIFDALRKAQAGRPAADPTFRGGAAAPLNPPELGPRGLAPAPARRQPERTAPGVEARPVIVALREPAELPDEVVREMTRLRVSLESLLPDRVSRSVMLVSAQGHEGTSTVAGQFAFTLARDTRIRTLLVDAHAHRPTLVVGGGEPAAPGIPTSPGAARAGEPRVLDGWPLGDQYHAVGLLSPALVREVIEWASGQYDWIVFDGPPVLESADAAPISAVADGVILVVEAGRTKRPVLQRAVELVRKAGGHVLGSVLNRRRLEIPEFIYRRI